MTTARKLAALRGDERVSRRGNALEIRMLGPLRVSRGGQAVALPSSRKARALLAYLALAPRPLGRSQLCELLWDAPSDPRGELRWCLSRLRSVIDAPAGSRILTRDDTLALDLSGCRVDATDVAQAAHEGIERLSPARQQVLAALFAGDFLEGLELDDSPAFGSWLTAQRRRLRGCHVALLEQLATRLPPEDARPPLETWLQLAPFDRRVHERLLATLARQGRIPEGEDHVRATTALFEAEGLDSAPIREAWRAARAAPAAASAVGGPRVEETGRGRQDGAAAAGRRASIAVMPFADDPAAPAQRGGLADALAHDVTTRLAKLRSLFVIAQGSTFALHERRIGPEEAGRMLDVDYVLGGAVQRLGSRLRVTVELTETRTARIIWSEILNHAADDALLVLDEIGNRIVASVAAEIETVERNRAILRPPSSLDAWEAHHRGLWHMYRFTQADNERAHHFFTAAIKLDPTFARAYAGLSFTHFQGAFQGWAPRQAETARALASASQALMADDRDPAAHWSMGRALWLRGDDAQAIPELQRAIELSPNFALGHYALAFVQAQAGDPQAAIASSDYSQNLSPFDPLLFGMLGSRAMALARLGRHEEAARCAVMAAARPNAHPHIFAIAAYTLALAGALDEARTHAAAVRRARPGYGIKDFLATFHFGPDGEALFRQAARQVGLA